MSLYDDAVLVMIPSAFKATKLYSVKPTDAAGDFTVANAGTKFRTNSDLKLEEIAENVPALDYDAVGGCPHVKLNDANTNLLERPLSFGHSYWTKSGSTIEGDPSTADEEILADPSFATACGVNWTCESGWTIALGLATCDGSSGVFIREDGTSATSGNLYKVEIEITIYNNGNLRFVGGSAGQATTDISGIGVHTRYIEWTGSNGNALFLSNAFDGTIDNASLKLVTGYPSPSVTYPTDAYKLVESLDVAPTGHSIIRNNILGTEIQNKKWTYSTCVKAGERKYVYLGLYAKTVGITYYGYFDLENGTTLTKYAGSTLQITPMADGWYICSLTTPQISAASGGGNIYMYSSDNGTSNSYTGDGTSGLYLAFAQLSEKSYAPTFTYSGEEGATSSMLADAAPTISAANSTAYDFTSEDFSMEFDVNFSDLSTSPYLYAKGVNFVSGWIIYMTTDGTMYVISNTASQYFTSSTPFNIDTDYNIIITRDGADVKIYSNGADVTATEGNHSISATTAISYDLHLGSSNTGSGNFTGTISKFTIYDKTLTPTEVLNLQ